MEENLEELNPYSVIFRYPDDEYIEPEKSDVKRTVLLAENIYNFVNEKLNNWISNKIKWKKDYLISSDSRYIAYEYPLIKPEDEENEPPEASLKIKDIITGNDYEMFSTAKYNIYEIVKR